MERHLHLTDVHILTTDLRHHTWFALSRREVIDLVEVGLGLERFGGDIDGDLIGCQGGTIEIRRHGTELIGEGTLIPITLDLSADAYIIPFGGGGIILYLVAIHDVLLGRIAKVLPDPHLEVGVEGLER